MKLRLRPDQPILLYVTIAGDRGTREVLSVLDTGADFVLIPTEDALRLGYDVANAPRIPLATANGVIEAPKVVLSEVSIGDLRAENVDAICYDMPGAHVSALLGLSLLRRFRITLDFPRLTLEIRSRPGGRRKARI